MKRNIFNKVSLLRGLLAALALIVVVSCSKEPAKELTVSPSAVELESDGAAQGVAVQSNVNWSASSSAGWLIVSPKTGTGSMEVSLKAEANISGAERTATVTFTSPDVEGLSSTVTVKQVPVSVTFSKDPIPVKSEGETVTFTVTSNTSWTILTSEETARVKLSTTSGSGTTNVSAEVSANPNNKVANIPLKFSYNGIVKTLILQQEPGPNTAPAKAEFLSPVNNASGAYVNVTFKWNCKDADGDTLTYHLYLSKDGSSFTEAGNVRQTRELRLEERLDANSQYYAKIKADDGAGGTSESDVISFTTSDKFLYPDGYWYAYQESKKENPVILVFTGDGFVEDQNTEGGLFDTKTDEAIEGLFSVEPYKSYREYFTIYKIVAYSPETGMSVQEGNIKRNTTFASLWEGGNSTGVSCNYDKVFNWVKQIPAVAEGSLDNMAIALIINEPVYAGTCVSYSSGRCIAMIPLQTTDAQFVRTFTHEFGGHGFGRLVDEYINYDYAPSQEVKDNYKALQDSWAFGYGLNMSVTNVVADLPWAHLYGRKDYEHVSMIEGGWLYARGIWRSEQVSCMKDNRLYFDSQSRYLIARRITTIANEQFDVEKFVAKDVQKKETSQTKADMEHDTRPLGATIFVFE